MGETLIGDWAKAGGVGIEKAYADAHREGGTLAVGSAVPAIERNLLNALPEAEWARVKGSYVLESWILAARSKIVQ